MKYLRKQSVRRVKHGLEQKFAKVFIGCGKVIDIPPRRHRDISAVE
jgi:hypothetical protein